MKDLELQKQFIALRTQGLSFDRISKEINVSKPTLIKWSHKFQFELNNLRAISLEALREELIPSREARARALAEQLRQVEEELKKRSLADVPTSRLFTLVEFLRRQIQRETGDVKFATAVEDIPNDDYHAAVQEWKA